MICASVGDDALVWLSGCSLSVVLALIVGLCYMRELVSALAQMYGFLDVLPWICHDLSMERFTCSVSWI
jgi:hypothetical protein